jgi:hypothetical protein
MGGSQSQNQDNPNFNMEEYNRRVNNAAIYQQGALHPNMAVHYTAPNEGKKTFAIEETQKRKVEAQFVFSKKSMQIVPSHNRLEMKFRYTAKAEGELTIFLLAQEIEEQATNITTEVHSEVKYTTVIGVTQQKRNWSLSSRSTVQHQKWVLKEDLHAGATHFWFASPAPPRTCLCTFDRQPTSLRSNLSRKKLRRTVRATISSRFMAWANPIRRGCASYATPNLPMSLCTHAGTCAFVNNAAKC